MDRVMPEASEPLRVRLDAIRRIEAFAGLLTNAFHQFAYTSSTQWLKALTPSQIADERFASLAGKVPAAWRDAAYCNPVSKLTRYCCGISRENVWSEHAKLFAHPGRAGKAGKA